jgi:hypothetical protein
MNLQCHVLRGLKPRYEVHRGVEPEIAWVLVSLRLRYILYFALSILA